MKNYFILFALFTSVCMLGQDDIPSIEEKPGDPDTARWVLQYYLNGAEQTARTEWMGISTAVTYGVELYREGGYIGDRRVASYDDYITDEVKTFVFTQGPVVDPIRSAIAGNLIAYGPYPITRDTSISYPLIGTYLITGASCGMPADTMEVSTSDFNEEIVIWHPKDVPAGGQGVMLLGGGVISVFAEEFGEQITVVQQDSITWRGANNCVWKKLN